MNPIPQPYLRRRLIVRPPRAPINPNQPPVPVPIGRHLDRYEQYLNALNREVANNLTTGSRDSTLNALPSAGSISWTPGLVPSQEELFTGFDSPTVELKVGEEEVSILIQRAFICKFQFFNKAFNGKFKEGTDNMMKLPEETPGSIRVLATYLLRGGRPGGENPTAATMEHVVNLFISAVKWNEVGLRNQCLKALWDAAYTKGQQGDWSLIGAGYNAVIDSSQPTSALRLLFIHIAHELNRKNFWPVNLYRSISDVASWAEDFGKWLPMFNFTYLVAGNHAKLVEDLLLPEKNQPYSQLPSYMSPNNFAAVHPPFGPPTGSSDMASWMWYKTWLNVD